MVQSKIAFFEIINEAPEEIIDQLIEDGEKLVQLLPEHQASSYQLKFKDTLEKAKKFRENQ